MREDIDTTTDLAEVVTGQIGLPAEGLTKGDLKLIEIFRRQGHADPVASALKHDIVALPEGGFKITAAKAPREIWTDLEGNARVVAYVQKTYSERIGLSSSTKGRYPGDEDRLVLQEAESCSVEVGEVDSFASF